ncbi:MAG: right-handed parallel beta-helix repeat-containing protein [Bacteroidota bacterium]
MGKSLILLFSVQFLLMFGLHAQTIYVDADAGRESGTGTLEAPFQSLEQAIEHANKFTDSGEIIIKLQPGIYLLKDKVAINPVRIMSDTLRYIIQAAVMPNDTAWIPSKMPVIQSISENNSNTQFPHSTGLLIASNHVTIKGLKFLGNPNPQVNYYYPISKENSNLEDLVISECYFIGDKETAKIQGGVWAHGPKNKISHCIFYGCRNGVLFFNNVEGFTIEHTIIYGSYESAFWFGGEDPSFTFTNNVIVNNANFLIGPENLKYTSPFSNSVIINKGFVKNWNREGVVDIPNPNIKMDNIIQNGVSNLQLNNDVALNKYHLHLTKESKGVELKAGIFR